MKCWLELIEVIKWLGNKFYMHNESERDLVCDKYQEWFDKQIKNGNLDVLNELRKNL